MRRAHAHQHVNVIAPTACAVGYILSPLRGCARWRSTFKGFSDETRLRISCCALCGACFVEEAVDVLFANAVALGLGAAVGVDVVVRTYYYYAGGRFIFLTRAW